MKQDQAGIRVLHGDVHGSMSPWPIWISECKPGLLKSNSGFRGRQPISIFICQCVSDEFQRLHDKLLQGVAVYHLTGRDGRFAVIDGLGGQVRCVEIESREQHERLIRIDRFVSGCITGAPSGQIERAVRLAFQVREEHDLCVGPGGGVTGTQALQNRQGGVECSKNLCVDRGLQLAGRKGHVLCMQIHPPVGRQRHEVRGTGTPGAAFLSKPAARAAEFFRRHGGGTPALELRCRGQRKVHQAGAAVRHLLRRHRRLGARRRTIKLRQCRARAGTDAGEHEQANHKRQT